MNWYLKSITFCSLFFAVGFVRAQCPANFVNVVGRQNPLCDSSQLDWGTWIYVNDTSGLAVISSQISVTVSKPSGGMLTSPNVFAGNLFPAQYNLPVNNTSLRNDLAGLFTFCFSVPVTNPVIALASIGNGNLTVPVVTSAPYVVIWAGPGMSYPNDTTFDGTEGYTIIQFPGTFTCITFDYLVSETYCNVDFGIIDTNCQAMAIPPICPGSPDTLHATGAVNYTWASTPGLNTTSGAVVVASPLVTTTYYVTGTDANSCTATDSFTVHVLPVYNDTVTQSICPGGSYSFNGNSYTQAGYYPAMYQTINGCDSIIVLHLVVNPVYYDTTIVGICEGNSYTFQDNSYAATGVYTVNYNTVNGCDSDLTLELTVNPVYADTIADTICEGGSYILGGHIYTTGGSYTLNYQTVNGCDSLVMLNLAVNPVYSDTVTQNICAGGSYSFNGNNYTQTGYYAAHYQTVNFCDSVITLHLIVTPVYNDTSTASICQGNSYAFQGNTYTTAGTYPFNYTTVSGCDSSITLLLTVNPVYYDTVTAFVCNGQTYTLPDGSMVSSAGVYTSNFNTVNGCDSSITTLLQVYPTYNKSTTDTICEKQTYVLPDGTTVSGGGVYISTLNTVNNCDSTISTELIINSEPAWFQAYITPATATVNLGKSVALTANANSNGPLSYTWLPVTGLTCSDCAAPVFDGNTSTTYNLTITDTNGCEAFAGIDIDVVPDYQVFIPNVFTPNGDGHNDEWQIFGNTTAMKQLEVTVYDRIGEKVFESSDINFIWDGTYRGKPAPVGVYVYSITIVWLNDVTAEPYKGTITLLR